MPSKRLSEETNLAILDTESEIVTQFHCPQCFAIFWYADDAAVGQKEKPKFCPLCGRRVSGIQDMTYSLDAKE